MSRGQLCFGRWSALAGGGGVALALSAMLPAASAFADDTAVILGGSGISIPPPIYVQDVNDLYLHCAEPTCTLDPLATPEGLYPIIGGPKGLPADVSVAQGVTILNGEIEKQLDAGNDVTVLGYSQGAQIATIEMEDITNGSAGIHPTADQLSFVLLGDPNNANGGLLERLDLPVGSDFTIPSFGLLYNGATPVTEFPTDIYSAEYDPISDFPKYPLNLLSDLNAALGFLFVHTQYPNPAGVDLADAVQVPTSAGYDGATSYFMLPTDDLPLLDPLRSVPVLGPILADLMQPDLKVLVNLGYGDPDYGWVNQDADVATPIGLLPSLADFEKVPGLLVSGTEQGIQQALSDLENPAQLFSLDGNPLLDLLQTPYLAQVASEIVSIPAPSDSLLGIVNAFSDAASNLYGTLLPTADFLNALVTTIPAEDATIFATELSQGDLLDAIGLPLAEDFGLLTNLSLFEIGAVGEGVAFAGLDLISPFVNVAGLFS